jgi:uncharacterized protein YcbK (DUF882 family)
VPDEQLTPHFNLSEFRCPCCNDVNRAAARALAERLEPVREAFGPIHVWSGFRCPKQNARVGGATFSQHLLGLAADIDCTDDAARFTLIRSLLEHGFKRIGIAKLYVHADIGTPTGPLIWTYYA